MKWFFKNVGTIALYMQAILFLLLARCLYGEIGVEIPYTGSVQAVWLAVHMGITSFAAGFFYWMLQNRAHGVDAYEEVPLDDKYYGSTERITTDDDGEVHSFTHIKHGRFEGTANELLHHQDTFLDRRIYSTTKGYTYLMTEIFKMVDGLNSTWYGWEIKK